MWKPRAMTSLRAANSPSSASAGGQEEHPCEVNSSTTVGRACGWAGEAADTSPRHNNAAAHATRCNATTGLPLPNLSAGYGERAGGGANLLDHICVQSKVRPTAWVGYAAINRAIRRLTSPAFSICGQWPAASRMCTGRGAAGAPGLGAGVVLYGRAPT